jgi:P-type Ca2+ transporter type 2C
MDHESTPVSKNQIPYWALPTEQALEKLDTTPEGITTAEAEARIETYGLNTISIKRKRTPFSIFLNQFTSPLICVLLAAGFITLVLGDLHDALFIAFTAVVNAWLGYYQENKAERALEHLKSYITSEIRVIRSGTEMQIDTINLVPGDIIHLTQGDRVPADARIIKSDSLRIDQSVLTGETVPVEKNTQPVGESALMADRTCIAFAGTMIIDGIAQAAVYATDAHTEFGKIASAVGRAEIERTPLQKSLRSFTFRISIAVIIASTILFGIALSQGVPALEAFLVSVAILVAAVPEGLPIITTIILAIGAQRLARRKGIVRRLAAAETLGSTSVILTDKTGTLTEAKMSLSQITMFEPEPAIKESISQEAFLLHVALLNVDAFIENPVDHHSSWRLRGKPLEVALVKEAAQRGVHFPTVVAGRHALHVLPFSSLNKFSASLYKMPEAWFSTRFKAKEPYVLSLLGAPEVLLKFSDISATEREKINTEITEAAHRGERIVGVAVKEVSDPDNFHFKDHSHLSGLRFLGIMAFKDPLRAGTKDAVERVLRSGIRLIIVTGDHEETAAAIATELQLLQNRAALLHGSELDRLSDVDLAERLKTITVIARVSPEGKLRVVRLLRQQGEIVAMTGDGINDAPALREADIGIAMGTGTDVSRDVADLVLLDDNFETIAAAISEGHRILSNLRKAIVFLSSTILSEVFLIGGSLLAGLVNPINALQILWINFLTESFPGVALAFEKQIDGIHGKPQLPGKSIFTGEMRYLIGINGVLGSVLLFATYQLLIRLGFDGDLVRTFIYACLGTYSLFIVASIRNLKASILSFNPFSNLFLTTSIAGGCLLTLAGVYVPFLQKYFNTVALPASWLLGVLVFGLLNVLLIEITKFVFRREN